MIRTNRYVVVALAVVLAAIAAASFMATGSPGAVSTDDPAAIPKHQSSAAWRVMGTLDSLITASDIQTIHTAKGATWRCQDAADLPRLKASPERTLLHASHGYRTWVAGQWKLRLAKCQTILKNTIPATGDWATAVHVVQRFYPGSEWWLMSCSASEGGHSVFVFHSPHRAATAYEISHQVVLDTPGGWMQYFHGTFVGDFNAAVQDLRTRHVRVPRSAFTWYSPLGQALAGGWAHNFGRYTGGKWTGSGC